MLKRYITIVIILLVFPLAAQKENQLLTDNPNLLIEYKEQFSGLVTKQGEHILPHVYQYIEHARYYSNFYGFYVFKTLTFNGPDGKEGEVGFADKNGKIVVSPIYKKLQLISSNMIQATNPSSVAFFTLEGILVTPLWKGKAITIKSLIPIEASKDLVYKLTSEEFGTAFAIMNVKGELISEIMYEEVLVKGKELVAYRTENGKKIIEKYTLEGKRIM